MNHQNIYKMYVMLIYKLNNPTERSRDLGVFKHRAAGGTKTTPLLPFSVPDAFILQLFKAEAFLIF